MLYSLSIRWEFNSSISIPPTPNSTCQYGGKRERENKTKHRINIKKSVVQLDFDGRHSQRKALQQEAKSQMLPRDAGKHHSVKSTASPQPPSAMQAPLSHLQILKHLSYFSSLNSCLFSLYLECLFLFFTLLIPIQYL